MIAVLLAALSLTSGPSGDTLSTKGLALKYKMFHEPPAVLLNGFSEASGSEGQTPIVVPMPLIVPGGYRVRSDTTMPQSKGVKRLQTEPRQKK